MLRFAPLLAALACGGSTSTTPEPSTALPAAGQRYDPAVAPTEVPDGAWMCDMGTVHFASPHAGECPVCGMALVHKE
ncbi:MAG: hypothetical protein EP330_18735 [Deltaproteobacteria bacterium]|nr:MAG: hypothetical protein EP330_18735 [Deltaproteobacteria bacterium]